jgi:Fe-S cluster biogenesis protein NfuA
VEHEELEEQQEDWQADFEEALQQLEEEEIADAEIQLPEPPPSTDTDATDTDATDTDATDTGATDTDATDSGEQRALTLDNVQAVFDELVRPALQADGGDITLVKVEDNNVYVELIGACSTCPSATMTMKMGIEQMLHDEFPDLGELVNVAGESQPFF